MRHSPLGRRVPVLAATLAFLVAGAFYGAAVPAWEAPDEPWHMVYAEALAAGHLPAAADTYEAHQPPLYYLWPALALRAGGMAPVTRAPDNPFYPFAAAALWHLPGDPGEPPLGLVRAFSGMLGALVVSLTWASARAVVPGAMWRPVLAAWTVALWPQFVFVGHAVSNDVLAAAAGGLLTYGLIRWAATPTGTAHSSAVLAAAGALAVATKLNAAVLLGAVAVVAIVIGWRARHEAPGVLVRRLAPACAALAGAAMAIVALWMVAPTAAEALVEQALTRGAEVVPELARAEVVVRQTGRTLLSLWARFGWLNVDMPSWINALAVAGAGLGALGLVRALVRDGSRERRGLAVALVVLVVGLLALTKNNLSDPQPQGRLLFPALPAVVLLLTTGWMALVSPARRPVLAIGVAGLLALANLVAVGRVLPDAYASARGALPRVDTRVIPPSWVIAAEIDGETREAQQTFRVHGPGLRRVAIPLVDARGDGTLALRLAGTDGGVIAEGTFALGYLEPRTWLALDVGSLSESAGQDYVLIVSVVPESADARVRLWGAPDDVYPLGALTVGGRPGTDLMLLTLLDGV